MIQNAPRGPVVRVKAQPNVYTLMLIVACFVLAVTVVVVLRNLLASPPGGYGLSLPEIFTGAKVPG